MSSINPIKSSTVTPKAPILNSKREKSTSVGQNRPLLKRMKMAITSFFQRKIQLYKGQDIASLPNEKKTLRILSQLKTSEDINTLSKIYMEEHDSQKDTLDVKFYMKLLQETRKMKASQALTLSKLIRNNPRLAYNHQNRTQYPSILNDNAENLVFTVALLLSMRNKDVKNTKMQPDFSITNYEAKLHKNWENVHLKNFTP